jgi:hypothetical protein
VALNAPLYALPIGVRAVETMTASRVAMGELQFPLSRVRERAG